MNAEEKRLKDTRSRIKNWKTWGPYLSERAWGTVREDYSADGSAWDYFPHDHARSRTFRWNEDGLLGICDRHQRICFSIALWNERDPILKERLFGLTGPEGNHGEDVKELYYYLDSTPTHSYMKCLYKYPQAEFPYAQLVETNRGRDKKLGEFEILDTGVFDDDKYFDVFVEYAKADTHDILIRITAANRGPEAARIHMLPTVWFRNTWTWTGTPPPCGLRRIDDRTIELQERSLGKRWLHFEEADDQLFTENETNNERLFRTANHSPFVKDSINDHVVQGQVQGQIDRTNPAKIGTKASVQFVREIPAGEQVTIKLRLTDKNREKLKQPLAAFDEIFAERISEADEFYAPLSTDDLSDDARNVQRQAFAGLLFSKQYYYYVVRDWLNGDPATPKPPASRRAGRNSDWTHLYNSDVISMPDKWEYPWYAAWDLAFHCIPLALVDPDFAKHQLILMLREWYMHPNGQIPAYEWAFGDVNPPVHAWAAMRVYQIEKKIRGKGDRKFLARAFQKLLINFTWWVNRKDSEGNNVFEGGFLGLDNIGVFDRSQPLPTGGRLAQSDGTSWMAMYCLNMLSIALELSTEDDAYEDLASKFWEHFLYISDAMNHLGDEGISLWDEEDGFYYDVLHLHEIGYNAPIKIRSIVGLIPLFAVSTIDPDLFNSLPDFKRRVYWFMDNREDLAANISSIRERGTGERRLLAVAFGERLKRVLKYMLDEDEFLSAHGIRALSRYHQDAPYVLQVDGFDHRVDYEPGESTSGLFGGNSNWRGPVWFPINYLMIESLQKFHYYYGDDLKIECPTGSGNMMNLWDVSQELSRRLSHIFLKDDNGCRPVYGENEKLQTDIHFRDHILFYEYFHGDNGSGLGASHQTGWTGLVAKLLQQSGE
ncbi:MAG: glucosidase [Acidobacteriota bacterium]